MSNEAKRAEAIHAMWHDPTTYDAFRHGPPYLPNMGQPLDVESRPKLASAKNALEQSMVLETLCDAYAGQPYCELAALLVLLRASTLVHQSHHWRTTGAAYYADHLLFDRLYTEALPFIDQLAERAVGLGSASLVEPNTQSSQIAALTREFVGHEFPVTTPAEFPSVSLKAVQCVVAQLKTIYEGFKVKGQLTLGLDKILQDISDKQEEYAYLLQQRCQVVTATDARWKATSENK